MKGAVQKQLLELFANGGKYSMPDLERLVEANASSISQTIARLRRKGYDIVQTPMYYMEGAVDTEEEQTIEERILKYLTKYGSINREEGQTKLGIENISVYIRNMVQNNGLPIRKDYEYGKTADGKDRMMVRYRLENRQEIEPVPETAEECAECTECADEYEEDIAKLEDEIAFWKARAEKPKWDELKKMIWQGQTLLKALPHSDEVITAINVLMWVHGKMQILELPNKEQEGAVENEAES